VVVGLRARSRDSSDDFSGESDAVRIRVLSARDLPVSGWREASCTIYLMSQTSVTSPLNPARNVVFLSPQFPDWVTKFVLAMGKHSEVNALGIGDEPYDSLPDDLKAALKEYYRVDSMSDYDAVRGAVEYFRDKYGSVDRFESLNEHWLALEAKIRQEFDIPGPKPAFIEDVRRKSRMKEYFERAGVDTIQGTLAANVDDALAFAQQYGYPIIVKPDSGSGAASTYRVDSEARLREVFDSMPSDIFPVVVEEYIDGTLLTYDGLVDGHGEVVFENSTRCDLSIMDVVNTGANAYYYNLPDVPDQVRKVGQAIIKAYDLAERFFHIEIFKRRNGGLVGLEINLRPPGAWMTDAMNVSHSTDVYARWTDLLTGDEQPANGPEHYWVVYASRKNFNRFAKSHQECLDYLGDRLIVHKPIEPILQAAMGDEAYLARADSFEEATDIVNFIQERA